MPAAAIIYATAIWLVNTGQDAVGVISGLMLIVLSILACQHSCVSSSQ